MAKNLLEKNQIITRAEVAEKCRVHPSTVSRWVKSGELKSYRIGGRVLFKEVDVVSFFENHLVQEYVSGKEASNGQC